MGYAKVILEKRERNKKGVKKKMDKCPRSKKWVLRCPDSPCSLASVSKI
jgi:hypothetical protein